MSYIMQLMIPLQGSYGGHVCKNNLRRAAEGLEQYLTVQTTDVRNSRILRVMTAL